jgi:hypothetical protein
MYAEGFCFDIFEARTRRKLMKCRSVCQWHCAQTTESLQYLRYTYSLLSCVQPNCSPCSLIFILYKCGEAGVKLCVPRTTKERATHFQESLHQGQVGHVRSVRAPAWRPSQHLSWCSRLATVSKLASHSCIASARASSRLVAWSCKATFFSSASCAASSCLVASFTCTVHCCN